MKTVQPTRLIENHFIQQAREFSRLRGMLVDNNELVRFQTGDHHPFFNGIMTNRLSDEKLKLEIAAAKKDAKAKQLPLSWITGPSTEPADTGNTLEEKGFINAFHLTGMYAPLGEIDFTALSDSPLEIKRVTTRETLEHWQETVVKGMGDDPIIGEFLKELFLKLGHDLESPWQNFVGYFQGKPVCTSSLFTFQEAAGIYCVATLPEFRERGFGQAITLIPLRFAAYQGIKHTVLHASEMAVSMYQKLGFREYCRLNGYLYNL